MKIFTVATAPNYNFSQANRYLEQLGKYYSNDFKLYCYTDDKKGFSCEIEVIEIPQRNINVERQWNKIDFFGASFMPVGETVVVSDLDWTFLSDVTDIIDTPLLPSQFMAIKRWWCFKCITPRDKYTINGGMYKFVSGELKHVFENFYNNPSFWQRYYIDIGETRPPVNGEQNFVWDMVSKTHDIVYFQPFDHIGRLPADEHHLREYNITYALHTSPGEIFYLENELNEKIRMVHSIF